MNRLVVGAPPSGLPSYGFVLGMHNDTLVPYAVLGGRKSVWTILEVKEEDQGEDVEASSIFYAVSSLHCAVRVNSPEARRIPC